MASNELKPIVYDVAPVSSTPDIRNVEEKFEPEYALALVNQTYSIYSSWRASNLDGKWQEADALKDGVLTQKVWPGTNMPRAAFPQPIVSDQFRTLLPSLEQALFPDSEDWFTIEPAFGGLPPALGRMITHTLKHWLDTPSDFTKVSPRRQIMVSLMDALLYKYGVVFCYWNDSAKRPDVETVDVRDLFFDPKAASPLANSSSSIIWRKMLTVRQLKEMRVMGMKDFEIPSDPLLYTFAVSAPNEPADMSKNVSNMMLGLNIATGPTIYQQSIEDREIEVLIYFSKNRIIWVLNKQWVAYNQPNEYGFLPFFVAPCYELPHKMVGESLPDVLKSSQRLSEGLMNNHLDALHLALNPPRVERQMSGVGNGDKWYPGLTIKVTEDAGKDIIFPTLPNPSPQIWDSIQWIANQSYSRTGTNPLQQGGIPTPSNANRTASGMQMQTSGGSARLYSMVKQIEDYMLIPLLTAMLEYCRKNIIEGEEVEGLNENGELTKIKGGVFAIPLKVTAKCASRVISRDRLQQFIPNLIQYLLQGPFVGALHQIGQTVDVGELLAALQDATGLGKRYQFTRPLSQQEIQQMQQQSQPRPDPNIVAKAQLEGQAKLQQIQAQGQVDIAKEQAKAQQSQNPFEIELAKAKVEMERELGQIKLAIESAKLDLARQKAQLDLMRDVSKANLKQQIEQMEAANQQQKMEMDAKVNEVKQTQALRHNEEKHQMELKRQNEKGEESDD